VMRPAVGQDLFVAVGALAADARVQSADVEVQEHHIQAL